MAVDLDSQGFWQWLIGVLGFGAGGYKVVTHEMRIRQLEDHRYKQVDPQLKDLGEGAARIESKLDGVSDDVKTIRDILIEKGVGK